MSRRVVQFSCGSASAIAAKLTVTRHPAADVAIMGWWAKWLSSTPFGARGVRPHGSAQGYGEVSPRTFLKALKVAAVFPQPPQAQVFSPEAIQDGVRQASDVRVREIGEDYPWVTDALGPLRGLLVPCDPQAVHSRWQDDGTVAKILEKYSGTKAPLELKLADLLGMDELASLQSALFEIGVLEVRDNGKLNFPDIFRISAGIGRRGGVPPQRRRH